MQSFSVAGDKSSVTVMGHGTGAACLHYLMTSDALPHGESAKIFSYLTENILTYYKSSEQIFVLYWPEWKLAPAVLLLCVVIGPLFIVFVTDYWEEVQFLPSV